MVEGGDDADLPYRLIDGQICRLRHDHEGNELVQVLANFDARIGDGKRRVLRLRLTALRGAPVPGSVPALSPVSPISGGETFGGTRPPFQG